MSVLGRIILCGIIIFVGGFSIGMLCGLYMAGRKERKEQKRNQKVRQAWDFIRENAEDMWEKKEK